MLVDSEFFDDIFLGGTITEERIEAACARIMQLAQANKDEAKKADSLLKDIILLGIANGLAADPQRCAEHYISMVHAAFGEPTLLDQVKDRFGSRS